MFPSNVIMRLISNFVDSRGMMLDCVSGVNYLKKKKKVVLVLLFTLNSNSPPQFNLFLQLLSIIVICHLLIAKESSTQVKWTKRKSRRSCANELLVRIVRGFIPFNSRVG